MGDGSQEDKGKSHDARITCTKRHKMSCQNVKKESSLQCIAFAIIELSLLKHQLTR